MKIKRILPALLLAVCLLLAVPGFAMESRLLDAAGLLTQSEVDTVLNKLDTTSEELDFTVAVITIDSLQGYDPEEAARQLYYDCGYGTTEKPDGVLLLLNMEERDWVLNAEGANGAAWFSDAARDYVADEMLPYLRNNEFKNAFVAYADACAAVVKAGGVPASASDSTAPAGTQSTAGDSAATRTPAGKAPFGVGTAILIAVVVGFLIGIIAVSVMKGKLKSVHRETAAANYMVENSLNVTRSNERYLYHNLVVTPKPRDTNSHSGGHSSFSSIPHSSSHGKF